MKIGFAVEPMAGFIRAASYLGHEGGHFNLKKPFISLQSNKFDLVICQQGRGSVELDRALNRFPTEILWVSGEELQDAVDCPPDFVGGTVKPEFECDVVIVGVYREAYREQLAKLLSLGLNVKIFGKGWPVAEYVGQVPAQDMFDIFKSAKVVLELDGQPSKVESILAAGGKCVGFSDTFETILKNPKPISNFFEFASVFGGNLRQSQANKGEDKKIVSLLRKFLSISRAGPTPHK